VNPSLGTLIVIGTRWPNDKVYQYILDTGGFDILTAGCYVDERCAEYNFGEVGDPIWPERFSHKVLEEIKATTPPFEWAHQYLNQPITEAFRRFPPSCIQYYDWLDDYKTLKYRESGEQSDSSILIKDLYRVLTVDPAASGTKTADESAISVTGKAEFARFFVLEDFGARVTVLELVDKIIELYEKWKPHVVGIEKGAFMHVLRPFIEQEQKKRGIYFPIVQLEGQIRNKVKRIDSLQPFFVNKQVWIGRSHGALQHQLLGYAPVTYKETGLPHDDHIDALAFHTKYWKSSFETDEEEDRIKSADEPEAERWYGLECGT
jgi:predicted phage terminase large subunit-like protein